MKMTTKQMKRLARTCTMFAIMLVGVSGNGLFAPTAAMAQVKSAADIKTLFKTDLPADAMEIADAMKTAEVGTTITVRGYVAISKDAFAEQQSVFTLVDDSVRSESMPSSNQPPVADIRATVQIVDQSGKPMASSLKGQSGLKSGAEVFVTGKVEAANGSDALVLTAISMHVPRSALPRGFFVEKEPQNANDVSSLRRTGSLKVGDEVVLRGRVGGSKEPFVAGRAVFTLMGSGLKACNENPDDHCTTPWDYCCETKGDILANSVTIQVVDAKGQILRTDMKGRHGLEELSEIVVVGKVTTANDKAVVVNATAMYRTSSPMKK